MQTGFKFLIRIGVLAQISLASAFVLAEEPKLGGRVQDTRSRGGLVRHRDDIDDFVTRRNRHLGQVTVMRQDLPAYNAFLPHLNRAMAVLGEIGIDRLPIRKTVFSGDTINPEFVPLGQSLNVGSLPPRNQTDFSGYNLVTLHEIGHAVLFQGLANKADLPFLMFVSENHNDFKSEVFKAYGEMFADVFAQLLLLEPTGISSHIEESNRYFNMLSDSDRFSYGLPTGALTLSDSGLERRNLTGSTFNRCEIKNPEIYLWFDGARRMIWNNRGNLVPMMSALVEYGQVLLRQIQANRVAIAAFRERPEYATLSSSNRLMGPVQIEELPEEYFDHALQSYLRTRFPQ